MGTDTPHVSHVSPTNSWPHADLAGHVQYMHQPLYLCQPLHLYTTHAVLLFPLRVSRPHSHSLTGLHSLASQSYFFPGGSDGQVLPLTPHSSLPPAKNPAASRDYGLHMLVQQLTRPGPRVVWDNTVVHLDLCEIVDIGAPLVVSLGPVLECQGQDKQHVREDTSGNGDEVALPSRLIQEAILGVLPPPQPIEVHHFTLPGCIARERGSFLGHKHSDTSTLRTSNIHMYTRGQQGLVTTYIFTVNA